MTNPLISVIIPVYNGEKYIEKCISSLLCQTFSNIEIIVVNDGSTDRTSSIAHNMQSQDDRIVVIDKQNEGVSVARNKALEIAKGEWIAFSDADDYYYPEGIALLYDVAKETSCKIVLGNSDRLSMDGRKSQRYPNLKNGAICRDYPKGSHEMWGDLFHASLFDGDGYAFEPGLAYLEDRLLMAKLFSKEGKYATCATPVYAHVKNDDSVLASKNGLRMAKHCFCAASLMGNYAKTTHTFASEIADDAEQAKNRGFMYFLNQKNAPISELRGVFYSYFDSSECFCKYLFSVKVETWKRGIKRKISTFINRRKN